MGLTIIEGQFNTLNAEHYGYTISQSQPNETQNKSGARPRMNASEMAFKKYEGQVAGALRSVIQIKPKWYDNVLPEIYIMDRTIRNKINKAEKQIKDLRINAEPILTGLKNGNVQNVGPKNILKQRLVFILDKATDEELRLLRNNLHIINKKNRPERNNGKLVSESSSDQSEPDYEDANFSPLSLIRHLVKKEQKQRSDEFDMSAYLSGEKTGDSSAEDKGNPDNLIQTNEDPNGKK